ncbi:MAG: NfeD family protein [Coriobacteriales bacterium]
MLERMGWTGVGFPIAQIVLWLIVAVVFVIVEFASSKYFLPFAIGAGIALVAALFSAPIVAQVVIFVVVALLGYLLFRPSKTRRERRREREAYYDSFDD